MPQTKLKNMAAGNAWTDRVRFPRLNPEVDQHEEYCEALLDGTWTKVRMHEYATLFSHPGFYETLFYDLLACDSPRRVVGLLAEVQADLGASPLRVLDVGAGNGLVGESLKGIGVAERYGIDILPEAREAAERDRPGLYHEYLVADLCNLNADQRATLTAARLNCLTCVAALGFGDIPAEAFVSAVNFVEDGGLIAFNIKEVFLDERYNFGFSALIRTLLARKIFRLEASRRYRHRLSSQGQPLYYLAMVVTKQGPVPSGLAI